MKTSTTALIITTTLVTLLSTSVAWSNVAPCSDYSTLISDGQIDVPTDAKIFLYSIWCVADPRFTPQRLLKDGVEVEVTITYEGDLVTISPDAPLEPDTTYTFYTDDEGWGDVITFTTASEPAAAPYDGALSVAIFDYTTFVVQRAEVRSHQISLEINAPEVPTDQFIKVILTGVQSRRDPNGNVLFTEADETLIVPPSAFDTIQKGGDAHWLLEEGSSSICATVQVVNSAGAVGAETMECIAIDDETEIDDGDDEDADAPDPVLAPDNEGMNDDQNGGVFDDSTTEEEGCSTTPGNTSGPSVFLLVLGLVGVLLRRRAQS